MHSFYGVIEAGIVRVNISPLQLLSFVMHLPNIISNDNFFSQEMIQSHYVASNNRIEPLCISRS